ncbi:hypothetical protein GV794_24220 [Nocardia cyriacigeorgica]|uniref:CARD domain-containing protein n=1 Tax=Nocardia cyriacigeorgica TaxID=135487 RepID=A0ABX0CQE0_9NOCA|nr:hypothetical protein [Nocardia cyriacigeorgica]NEW58720.1 hypothetical protein [Nocardia cyriacigeorgica]
MAIDFPSVLGWVVGSEWPDGNEDDMWLLAEDWRKAAKDLEDVIADVRAAKTASLNAYPSGEAPAEIAKAFDSMLYATEGHDKGSLEQLIEGLESMGESADKMGTEIEYAKLMFISSLVLLAAELAAAWIFPPTAPAVQAAAIALTRIAARVISQRVMAAIRSMVLALARKKFLQFMVRHVAIDTIIGTGQDLGIQAWQVSQGHRDNIDWTQVGVTAISSAAGGAAAGPLAGRISRGLGGRFGPDGTMIRPPRVNNVMNGMISGAGAGLAGSVAGYGASLGAQFGFDWAQHGWDKANENLGNALNNFDPRVITAGVSNGAMSGANKARANQFWQNHRPGLINGPSFQTRIDAAIFGPGGAPGSGGGGTPGGTGGGTGGGAPGGTGGGSSGGPATGQGGNTNGGNQSGGTGEGQRSSPARAGDGGGRTDDGSRQSSGEGDRRGDGGDTRATASDGGRGQGEGHSDSGRAGDATRGDGVGDRSGETRAGAAQMGNDGPQADGGLQAQSRGGDDGVIGFHGDPGIVPARDGDGGVSDGEIQTGEPIPAAAAPALAVPPAGAPPQNQAPTAGQSQAGGETRGGATSSSPARGVSPVDGRAPSGDGPVGSGPDRASVGDVDTPATPRADDSDPTGPMRDEPVVPPEPRAGAADRPVVGSDTHQPGVQAGVREDAVADAGAHRSDDRTPATGELRTGTPDPDEPRAADDSDDSDLRADRDDDETSPPAPMFVIPPPDLSTSGPGRDDNRGINRIGQRDGAPVTDRTGEAPRTQRTDAALRDTDGVIYELGDDAGAHHAGDASRRGRCAELALRLLKGVLGIDAITPPTRLIGPDGMSAAEVEAAAGGRLRPFDGHQAIADRLLALGDGASALVVDNYTGATDRYRVGAHAYALVNENGTIMVRDPGAGRVEGFPPTLPREVREVCAVLYGADATPVEPLGDTVPAGTAGDSGDRVGQPGDTTPAAPQPHPVGEPVPAGMFVGNDGFLHRPGDRTDSYRDPDGTWHHKIDRPNTFRDRNFQLRGPNGWIPDVLVAAGYLHQAQRGPETTYQVTDPEIGDRLARASADRLALQTQRDAERDAMRGPMASFGITDIHDLAPKRLGAEMQSQQRKILADQSLSDADRAQRLKDLHDLRTRADKYNTLGRQMVATSKLLGELGGTAFAMDPALRPGAVQITPFDGAFDGANVVDIAVLVPGTDGNPPKLVVVEAKGVGSILGGSKTASAQQGSPEYLRRTVAIDRNLAAILSETSEQMRARGIDPDSPEGRELTAAREELLRAHRDRTLTFEYHLAHTSETGEVTVSRFRLDRSGVPVDIDVVGGIDAATLAADRDQTPSNTPRDTGPLGGPSADEWTVLPPAEVGERMRDQLRQLLDNPDLEVFGFDRPDLDADVAREFARAMVDMAGRHPQVDVRRIGIGDLSAGLIGLTRPFTDPATGAMRADSITLSSRYAADGEQFRQWMGERVAAGRFHPSVMDRPVYAAAVHEFGHAVDYAGRRAARLALDDDLIELYVNNRLGAGTVDSYDDWLRSQLTGYSFDKAGELDPGEALAEAFVDVVLNGRGNVNDAVGRAYDLLTDTARGGEDARRGDSLPGDADQLGDAEDSDRMSTGSGPEQLRPPTEDVGIADLDADILGVTGTDEWSNLDPPEVGERLRDLMREATGNPDFEVFGFDLPWLNAQVVREFARGITDMYAQHPQVDLRSVGIGELSYGVLGETAGRIDHTTGAIFSESITLNYDLATSAYGFREQARVGVANGQFTQTILRRPVYFVAVHEYGHALDYGGGGAARQQAEGLLLRRAAEDPNGDFGEWLRELSGYSLDDDGMLRSGEALAEALAEYVVGGPANATTPTRILRDLLISSAENLSGASDPQVSEADRIDASPRSPGDSDPASADTAAGAGGGAKKPPTDPPPSASDPDGVEPPGDGGEKPPSRLSRSGAGTPDGSDTQFDSNGDGAVDPDSIDPPPQVTIDVDGQQVRVDVRPDGANRWRVVDERTEPDAVDTRSRMRREWDAVREMMPVREEQTKYPSGSPVGDSAGQAAIRDGITGAPDLIGPPPPTPPPPPSDIPRFEAPPEAGPPDPTLLRLAQQAPVWVQNRELIPIFGELSGRMRAAAGEHLPMRTPDGQEYRPELTDANADQVREQLISDLDVERITPEQAREDLLEVFTGADAEQRQRIIDDLLDRELITTEEAERLADEPPADTEQAEPAGPPSEGESLTDAARRLLDVELPDESLRTLRELIDEHQYRVVRAAAAIEGLAAAAQRLHEEQTLPFTRAAWDGTTDDGAPGLDRGPDPAQLDGPPRRPDDDTDDVLDEDLLDDNDDSPRPSRFAEPDPAGRAVPFGGSVSFTDQNPMGRFRNEIIAAFGHHLGLLDTVPIGNGADPLPEWGDGDELGRDEGLRKFFEHALRRDQLRDELATWAAMRDLDVRQLARDLVDDTLNALRDANVARSDRVAEFADLARHRYPETDQGELVGDSLGDQAVRIPMPDGPDRLVIVDGERSRHQVLADTLAADPQLVRDLADGRVVVDYRSARTDWTGRTHLDPVDTPQVLHRQETVNGRELSVTLVREGEGPWRAVPESDAPSTSAPEGDDPATTAPRPRDEVLADLIRVMRELGLGPADVHPDMINQTVADQKLDNAVRAAQIEGLTDFIRSANDIQTFHEVGDARSRLATRLGIPQAELTGDTMAAALGDTTQRRALRAQQFTDLAAYAGQLREVNATAVDAARNRLAERLVTDDAARRLTRAKFAERAGVSRTIAALLPPGRVDGPNGQRVFAVDPTGLSPKKLRKLIRALERAGQRDLVNSALTEYANALLNVDPYAGVARGDTGADPRVIDGRFPMHDRDAMTALREIIADAVRTCGADDFARAVADAARRPDSGPMPSDDPARRPTANRDWARIVGVDITDADDATFRKVYEAYRDGRIEKHEGLTPEKLAAELTALRNEVRDRAQRINDLVRLTDEFARALRAAHTAAGSPPAPISGAGDGPPPPSGPPKPPSSPGDPGEPGDGESGDSAGEGLPGDNPAGSGSGPTKPVGPARTPSAWYERQQILQAEWEARMAAEHAAFLRAQADAHPDDRWAGIHADQAEWSARMAEERVKWLRDTAIHPLPEDPDSPSESPEDPDGPESPEGPGSAPGEPGMPPRQPQSPNGAEPPQDPASTPPQPVGPPIPPQPSHPPTAHQAAESNRPPPGDPESGSPTPEVPNIDGGTDHGAPERMWGDRPFADVVDFLREVALRNQADPVPLSDRDRAHVARLAELLGLGERLTRHPDPLGALAELAELALVHGFLDAALNPDAGPLRPMRYPADFTYPAPDQPGLWFPPEGQAPPAPAPDPVGESVPRSGNVLMPEVNPIAEVATELARKYGLGADDLDTARLAGTVTAEQYRNLVRAAVVEALADAVARLDTVTDPDGVAATTAERDRWAGCLDVDLGDLTDRPDQTVDRLRGDVLRRIADINDLADAVLADRQEQSGETGGRRYTITVDGDRVPVRLVDDGNGGWRVEAPERLRPAVERPERQEPKAIEKKKSWLRRVWDALRGGYGGANPKYPSGSGVDGAGQSFLGHGYLPIDLTSTKPAATPGGSPTEELTTKFNPARILKEGVTMWKSREYLPFARYFTGRLPTRSGDVAPIFTPDGDEYAPWIDEVDQRELRAIQADLELAGLAGGEPPIRAELPPGEPAARAGELEDGEPLPDWARDLADSLRMRAADAAELRRLAGLLGMRLPDLEPETLRRAVADARYAFLRRAGAIEGLYAASRRYNAENAAVPYGESTSFFDEDPLGRALIDRARARGERTEILEWEGVNNGGEPGLDWGPEVPQERDKGNSLHFQDALRREQLRDERGVWAQLLGVGIDELSPPKRLDETIAALRDELSARVDLVGEFSDRVRDFLAADSADRVVRVPGEPPRIIVVNGRGEHEAAIAGELARDHDLAGRIGRGEVEVEFHGAFLDRDGIVHIVQLDTPEIRQFRGDIDGRPVAVTMVREPGGQWHVVPDPVPGEGAPGTPDETNGRPGDADRTPGDTDRTPGRAERSSDPASDSGTDEGTSSRSAETSRAERNALAGQLGISDPDSLSPRQWADELAKLWQDNLLRATQIEGLLDATRSADAIDRYHALDNVLGHLVNRLEIDRPALSPELVAQIIADPDNSNERGLQQLADLADYAEVLRELDKAAVNAAVQRLAQRLGVPPEGLYGSSFTRDLSELLPDPDTLDPAGMRRAINAMVYSMADHPAVVDALTDFVHALGDVDPFTRDLQRDPSADPRVGGSELPVHDPSSLAFLLDILGDTGLFAPLGSGQVPDNPTRRPSRDYLRILGVDITDASDDAWDEAYQKFRDGRLDLHERLKPAQLAEVQATLRAEIHQRAADIRHLAELANDVHNATPGPHPDPQQPRNPDGSWRPGDDPDPTPQPSATPARSSSASCRST